MRPLKNPLFRHSGLDPESRKYLKTLDTGLRRYDDITFSPGYAKVSIS